LGTSLPRAGYAAEEGLAAYRLRWQIELAFKRLKSLLGIDKLPTHTERASRSWLTAHLIMALLCDEASQQFLAASPEDLLDAAYLPSPWRVWDMARRVLLAAVLGGVAIGEFLTAALNVHRRLAHSRRRRAPQGRYPIRT
jgi:Transposase DDE domain